VFFGVWEAFSGHSTIVVLWLSVRVEVEVLHVSSAQFLGKLIPDNQLGLTLNLFNAQERHFLEDMKLLRIDPLKICSPLLSFILDFLLDNHGVEVEV
jgi:hypothetical protein